MSDERLYREEEVNQIFEAAAKEPDTRHQPAPTGNALTLRELQEIGRQVGIEPKRIAEAARAIDSGAPAAQPFGVPITVRRTVALPRAPTEAEWLMLVTELRETFDAPGKVGASRGIYEWSNGSLHAFIEPTATGYRLRMGTRKRNAVAMGTAGLVGMAWSALALVGLSVTGNLAEGFMAPVIVSVLGAGVLGAALFRVPSWARTRAEQMERIARHAQALLGSGTENG
jgi:hypothetical protein